MIMKRKLMYIIGFVLVLLFVILIYLLFIKDNNEWLELNNYFKYFILYSK